MFKKLIKRILEKELQQKDAEIKEEKDRNEVLESALLNERVTNNELTDQLNEAKNQLKPYKKKIEQLEEENAVLRQYYLLNEEPSQETKDKMYLDMKCLELRRENDRLKAISEVNSYITSCMTQSALQYGLQSSRYYPIQRLY